jgi:CRP/FNR family transcriptional regulator, cyclic AMP receptor protein
MPADPEILKSVPFFQTLDDDERAAVAALMHDQKIPAGTTIFREHDPGGILFVITRGQVELSVIGDDRNKLVVDVLEPGEFFGEVSLLDGGDRTATAAAVGDVDAVCLERDPFLDLLRRRPDVALDVLAAFAKRFRKTDQLLRRRVPNPNQVMEERATFGERVADGVARFGGSWPFIFCFAATLTIWVLLNTLLIFGRSGEPFDPYPFILLNLFLSMLAAIQAPVIMMSQNRTDVKDRIRSELDYQVNLKAAVEITQLHEKFDDLRREILSKS